MSGEGSLSAPRAMKPRLIDAEAEREAVMLYLRAQAASVRRMAGRVVSTKDRFGDEEVDQLGRRIDALADGIAAGLHLPDGEGVG